MSETRLAEIRGLIKDGQYSDFDLGELLAWAEAQQVIIDTQRETIEALQE